MVWTDRSCAVLSGHEGEGMGACLRLMGTISLLQVQVDRRLGCGAPQLHCWQQMSPWSDLLPCCPADQGTGGQDSNCVDCHHSRRRWRKGRSRDGGVAVLTPSALEDDVQPCLMVSDRGVDSGSNLTSTPATLHHHPRLHPEVI